MTYFERSVQLRNTLYSFSKHGYDKNVEVIVVDDGSVAERATFPPFSLDFSLKILRIEPEQKWYRNACVPFNYGLKAARGNVILIQNAECLHCADIAGHAIKNVNDGNYLSYACYSIDSETTASLWSKMILGELSGSLVFGTGRPITDGAEGWYNHSKYNPTAYHFCSGITNKNLRSLGGFDEKYARGIGYDDNEILHRVREFPLEVRIIDDAIVLHQFHYSRGLLDLRPAKYYDRNKLLFEKYTLSGHKAIGYVCYLLAFYVFNQRRVRRHISDIGNRVRNLLRPFVKRAKSRNGGPKG